MKLINELLRESFLTDKGEVIKALKKHFETVGSKARAFTQADVVVQSDGAVDVAGDVVMHPGKLKRLPVKFGTVTGKFDVSHTLLETLEGSPTIVGGFYDCSHTNIKDFKGSPERVGGWFGAHGLELTSAEGMGEVFGSISLAASPIESLKGFAPKIHKTAKIEINAQKLKSLEGFPKVESPHRVEISDVPEDLGMLRLFTTGAVKVSLPGSNGKLEDILNEYLPKGRSAAMAASNALIDAGLTGNARA